MHETLPAMSLLSEWCTALRDAPARAPDGCDYILNEVSKPKCHQDENIDQAISRFGLHGNRSSFLGYGHDWWLYHNHAKFMDHPGVYLDLATNDPVNRNNAFFVDHCLGWRGLCFEPGPQHHARVQALRSCQLVPTCISNRPNTTVRFATGSNKNTGGDAHLVNTPYSANPANVSAGFLSLRCTTMAAALADAQITHVDFLSLDLEGHELPALLSLDFAKTTVDIIIVEDKSVWRSSPERSGGTRSVRELLVQRYNYTMLRKVLKARDGDRHFQDDDVYLRPGFKLGIERTEKGDRRLDGPRRCLYRPDGTLRQVRGALSSNYREPSHWANYTRLCAAEPPV